MSVLIIKKLREKTGAGFLDCKNAFKASNGDFEKAIEWLQKRGIAKVAKKTGIIAAEGVVSILSKGNKTVIYEVNSQTDFVATNEQFLNAVNKIGNILIKNNFKTSKEANALLDDNGKTILEICTEIAAKIGEKIVLRRAKQITISDSEVLGSYVHVNKKIASIIVAKGGSEKSLRNVAMHIASMNPQYLDKNSIPQDKLNKINIKIESSKILQSKPENIRENIAKGMLKKQLSEITLVDQEFVMEKMTISKYLSNNFATAIKMIRYEVGEGIEKLEQNFISEVVAQMNK